MWQKASSGSGGGGTSGDTYYLSYNSATYYIHKNGELVLSTSYTSAINYDDDNLTFTVAANTHTGSLTTKKACTRYKGQGATAVTEYTPNTAIYSNQANIYAQLPFTLQYM